MILDLKRIFVTEGSSLEVERQLDFSDLEYMGLYPLKKPVSVNGIIKNKASVVSMTLDISYEYEAPCDRCGKDTSHEHTVHLEKMLATALERQESDTILEVPGMKFDVDEFVFTEVVVSLPTKHLCKEECKGICSVCGKDLNTGDCDCNKKEIDPRLAVLQDLLKN